MKYYLTLLLMAIVQFMFAQNLSFSNANLKTYLISENSVDLNGNEIADTIIDTNNDGEIQLSEALLIQNLIISPTLVDTISSIQDISQFSNLKRLTIPGDFGLTNISNLGLDSLEFIRVTDHNSIINIDFSDLPQLTSIYLEGLDGVINLNLRNGSYASNAFSLFYTYVQFACVDSIALEYNLVAQHFLNGNTPSLNCTVGIVERQEDRIEIYPNPTNNKIWFSKGLGIESVELYNLNGVNIMRWHKPRTEIDISFLSAGVYVLKLKSQEGTTYIQRVIKK